MEDVVDLGSYKAGKEARDEAAAELVAELEEIAERLFGLALNTACRGPWKAWSDAQPVGAVLHVDEAELASCGDERVVALVELHGRIRAAMERLATM